VPPPRPRAVHIAAIALIRRDDDVLLVESRYPNRDGTFWALPGGMLEADETVEEGLAREVLEETGLAIGGHVQVSALIWLTTANDAPPWLTLLCEPESFDGGLSPDDPDRVTLRAAFVPVDAAIQALDASPWGLGHAIVARLGGASVGGIWTYTWNAATPWEGRGPATLVSGPRGS
jgi:ADP-ribose pyrophosphatase YjhB (NUDIX family)